MSIGIIDEVGIKLVCRLVYLMDGLKKIGRLLDECIKDYFWLNVVSKWVFETW